MKIESFFGTLVSEQLDEHILMAPLDVDRDKPDEPPPVVYEFQRSPPKESMFNSTV